MVKKGNTAEVESVSNEPVKVQVTPSSAELAQVQNWADAISLMENLHGTVITSDVLGDGFAPLNNKDLLVGTPMMILDTRFSTGDFGEFVILKVITKDGKKYFVTDGSTGIYEQMKMFTEASNRTSGLLCMRGLRKSEYEYQDEKGNMVPAKTYYVDTSAE